MMIMTDIMYGVEEQSHHFCPYGFLKSKTATIQIPL